MAFPRTDRQYTLITDAATGTADTPGGLGAILTQVDLDGKFYTISFASRQLKDHEKNYLPFLLKAAAAVWGITSLQQIFERKKIHPLHGSQTSGKTWTFAQQDHEPLSNSTAQTRLHDPVQKGIRYASRLLIKTPSHQ
jgi:hypothetical protein